MGAGDGRDSIDKVLRSRMEHERDSEWVRKRRAHIDRLREEFGAALTQTGNHEYLGVEDPEALREIYGSEQSVEAPVLDNAGRRARADVLRAVFPALGELIVRACETVPLAPAWREPFHAPGDPRLRAEREATFVTDIVLALKGYDRDAAWIAAWNPLLSSHMHSRALSHLLTTAIDEGGEQGERVLAVLVDGLEGRHETARVTGVAIRALMGSSRPEAWKAVMRLLLSAKREEGLRSSILDWSLGASAGGLAALFRTLVDEGMARFSSIVQTANLWFNLSWDSAAASKIEAVLRDADRFLLDEPARERTVREGTAHEVYTALWCAAAHDVDRAAELARAALSRPEADVRFAAVSLAAVAFDSDRHAGLYVHAAQDDDIRVAWSAARCLSAGVYAFRRGAPRRHIPGALDALIALARRFGDAGEIAVKPLLWPWDPARLELATVVDRMGDVARLEDTERVLPWIDRMSVYGRGELLASLTGVVRWEHDPRPGKKDRPVPEGIARALALRMLTDASSEVRGIAGVALSRGPVRDDEAAVLPALLKRSASDTRTFALKRLASLPDERAAAIVEGLLRGDARQRRGGLELLDTLATAGRARDRLAELAALARSAVRKPDASDRALLASIDAATGAGPTAGAESTRETGFGLFDPARRAPVMAPRDTPLPRVTPGVVAIVRALHDTVVAHAGRELAGKYPSSGDVWEVVIGDEEPWRAPRAGWRADDDDDGVCPVPDMVEAVLGALGVGPERARDLAIAGALVREAALGYIPDGAVARTPEEREIVTLLPPALFNLKWMEWLLAWTHERVERAALPDELIDVLEAAAWRDDLRKNGAGDRVGRNKDRERAGLFDVPATAAMRMFHGAERAGLQVSRAQQARLWRLLRWIEAERPEATTSGPRESETRLHPWVELVGAAREEGLATDDDVLAMLFTPSYADTHGPGNCATLSAACAVVHRDRARGGAARSHLDRVLQRAIDRVLEIELARGDRETPATTCALSLQLVPGADRLVRVLGVMARVRLKRKGCMWSGSGSDRASVFTHLVRSCEPAPTDTPDSFASLVRDAAIGQELLVGVAVLCPRWARFVERALAWDGLEEAVWWVHAHTKSNEWAIGKEEQARRDARVSEFSPVAAERFADGAADAPWFHRVHARLGDERWHVVHDAAKFACSNAGHTRARLFADVLRGRVTTKELVSRINASRHQDSVRALGLAPLRVPDAPSAPTKGARGAKARTATGGASTSARGAKAKADAKRSSAMPGAAPRAAARADSDTPASHDPMAEVHERYALMQEFRRTSRKHGGSMLQASEKRAVEIGMENLAFLAGFADPLRLEWAMETRAVADLARGPVIVTEGNVVVTLRVDDEGEPTLTAARTGKAGSKELKSIPPAVKKLPSVAALAERLTGLRRLRSRVRGSLEQAMCRGDAFRAGELRGLLEHPILRPAIERLVFARTDAGGAVLALGYPDKGGRVLRSCAGELEPLRDADALRLAHPLDLLAGGAWDRWQRDCFSAERVQPFKQVFREVYVPTAAERTLGQTVRYAGQQVMPRQALALLGGRGWVSRPEEGVQRTFHREGLVARLEFEEYFFTPGEVEGLTLSAVRFTRRGEYKALELGAVPPRLFSETMRDVDLIVSVAHRGGVDPEASASTVEVRAALVRETAAALRLGNVQVEGNRALIDGALASYSVHLGSAVAHVRAGRMLLISPVFSQHRGRLFLPFADDDPKTAEVLTKVLMLSRDTEIRDPLITGQIRG